MEYYITIAIICTVAWGFLGLKTKDDRRAMNYTLIGQMWLMTALIISVLNDLVK